MQALVDPGDRVLLFEPYWPWYLPCIRMAGGVPIAVRLEAPGWALDARELADVFARERPKLVITNTPHNPTGRVLARGELERRFRRDGEVECVGNAREWGAGKVENDGGVFSVRIGAERGGARGGGLGFGGARGAIERCGR